MYIVLFYRSRHTCGYIYTNTNQKYNSSMYIADKLEYHNGSPFSTYDRENDASNGNCAENCQGGNHVSVKRIEMKFH